jgi:NADPH-dependent glutamate synthase beta subunit-like oxidoreductase/Pyruvate/2-oxoacid:ferredoxin oxidoreductase delta subunit
MAIKVKKKKKKGFVSRGTGATHVDSGKRPYGVPKLPGCALGCPAGNNVRRFVTALGQAEKLGKSQDQAFEEAWHIYTETSPFPATQGRICPHPCEAGCNRVELDGAVGINKIERSIGDYGLEKGLKLKKLTDEKRPEKIAVVGAGPAGIACAYHLVRQGYNVTIYEASDKPGGMLLWGIPRYRLPEDVLMKEIQNVLDLGVELKLNTRIGKDISLDQLKKDYDAVFLSIGAHKGKKLGVEGEDAENVFSGVEFLNRIHHGEKVEVGDNVIVVGGGDTAIDAARICKRLGATTTIVYRRTIKEMPAIDDEIEEAQKEGIKLEYLAAPVGFTKENNHITHMKCIRMELGEPDDSGRRRPVPIEGSEFEIPATTVIAAISQEPEFEGFESLIEGRDWFKVDEHNKMLKDDELYAGGDVLNLGLATDAVGHGRCAAQAIDFTLRGVEMPPPEKPKEIKADKIKFDFFEKADRQEQEQLAIEERLKDMIAEVNKGLTHEQAMAEAKRCMSCGYCFGCEQCWIMCQEQAIIKPQKKGEAFTFDLNKCNGCDKCAEVCPCGYIEMQ